MPQPAEEPAERKPARPGLVTELERGVRMRGLELFDEPLHLFVRAAEDAPTAHLGGITGRDGTGDGVIVDIQSDVEDNVHVSAFLSVLSLTTNHCGSALRPLPGRHPRSRKADTLGSLITSHSD